jgi:hypothetical protein
VDCAPLNNSVIKLYYEKQLAVFDVARVSFEGKRCCCRLQHGGGATWSLEALESSKWSRLGTNKTDS